MSKGITPDGKWKWWGIFGQIYILKRIKRIADINPSEWEDIR